MGRTEASLKASLTASLKALDVLVRHGDVDAVRKLIDGALADETELARCAAMSFRHTLGFERYVLPGPGPELDFRLHVWRPGASRTEGEGHIHNHRVDVVSVVLRGALTTEVFDRGTGEEEDGADEGTPCVEYREHMGGEAGDWVLDRVGVVTLRRTGVIKLGPSSNYLLDCHALHRVSVGDQTTVTLSARLVPTRWTTSVFAPADAGVPDRITTPPTRPAEFRRGLLSVATELGS